MKKRPPRLIKISGQLDSLTDHLKQILFSAPGQTVEQLLPAARRRLATRQTAAKVEKNLARCLKKNPAFQVDDSGKWFLNKNGLPENEVVWQFLLNHGGALSVSQLEDAVGVREEKPALLEKNLVQDARFVRLKQGKWALVQWQVTRRANVREMNRLAVFLAGQHRPLHLDYLAQVLFKTCPELSDLETKLKRDSRFLPVGEGLWFLADKLPRFRREEDTQCFPTLRQAEHSALQEAELLLILNDTDPDAREYLLSSQDLTGGAMRLSRRMEKLFSHLPPTAYLTIATPSGPIPCWYSRADACLVGLREWFEQEGLTAGAKLLIAKGEDQTFFLECTGEKEINVYQTGERLRQLESIRRREQERKSPLTRLISDILLLFSEGLTQEELQQLLNDIIELDNTQLVNLLATYPFYECKSDGKWRFNQAMYQAYERMEREMLQTESELKETRQQIAASGEEARQLMGEKERLEDELYYLENHHREEEMIYRERVAQLREENEALQRENARLLEELEKLERRREQAKHQAAGAEERAEILRQEKEILEEKLQQAESRQVQMQGYWSKTMEEMAQDRSRLQRQAKEYESQLKGVTLANQDLHRTIEKLQAERRSLKKQMAAWPVRLAVGFSRLFGAR